MSWSLHELLGNRYPIYFCQHCQRSFQHPADEHPSGCPVCSGFVGGPVPCEHQGHHLLPRND